MIEVAIITFNAFQENTYLVYNQKKECIIFDPGCSDLSENKTLSDFISAKNLKPIRLINTHAHIDHILGNKYVADTYNLPLEIHKGELEMLHMGPAIANMYNIPYTPSPDPEKFIEEGDDILLGEEKFTAIFTPGHSPASLSFYNANNKILIAGDVLFQGSIGRTDLPGGDYDTLISSIKEKLLVLQDDVRVYPGHGPETNIGFERKNNPFLQ
jgi:glyoxylase-like metal-dependent hydrolase (beta-lactamase superfamily II)